jgi:hypothetical protein
VVSEHFPWPELWANIFYFCRFFFSEKKKEGRDIPEFSVYFCEKFAEKGCISEFLSEKHPSLKKKNRPKRSPEGQDIEVLKSANFQGFFCGRRRDLFLFL